MIYLDYNAITCGFESIANEVHNIILENKFLNASSIHGCGKKAKNIIENSKEIITKNLNAKCHDIYFVSGATEGNNMVLNSQNFDVIFTLKTEHDSILFPIKNKNHIFIKTSKTGVIDLNDLEEKIKSTNASNFLCSFMAVNNESGLIQDVNSIAKIVSKYNGILHSDVSQIIGKEAFSFATFDADIITFSGNKIHSGFGGGCVVFKSGFDIKPLIIGGGQQNYKRGGTENVIQIYALAQALEMVNNENYLLEYKAKTSLFREKIENTVMAEGGDIFAKEENRVSNTSLIKMGNINNFIQMMEFDLNAICVSIGSACSSGRTDVSHVLKACDVSDEDAKKYIRASTGIFNTEEEIEKFCQVWSALSRK